NRPGTRWGAGLGWAGEGGGRASVPGRGDRRARVVARLRGHPRPDPAPRRAAARRLVLGRPPRARRRGAAHRARLRRFLEAHHRRVGLAYPPDPEGRHPRTQVLRTGRAILVRDVTDDMLAAITDPESPSVMKALGYRSAVIVPLIARGEIRGALTLATVERRYDERDLALAEELARCASIAVDNARLYRDAQEEIARRRAAERRLAGQPVA